MAAWDHEKMSFVPAKRDRVDEGEGEIVEDDRRARSALRCGNARQILAERAAALGLIHGPTLHRSAFRRRARSHQSTECSLPIRRQ